jgi:hypothetical protein
MPFDLPQEMLKHMQLPELYAQAKAGEYYAKPNTLNSSQNMQKVGESTMRDP